MIRVGGDYQAQIPEFKPGKAGWRKSRDRERKQWEMKGREPRLSVRHRGEEKHGEHLNGGRRRLQIRRAMKVK